MSFRTFFFLLALAAPAAARADATDDEPGRTTAPDPAVIAPTSPPPPGGVVAHAPPGAAAGPRSVPRRTVGQVFTVIGIVETTVGAIVSGIYAYETRPGPPDSLDGGCRACFPPFPNFIGPAIMASGAIDLAIGIPLWISGALPNERGVVVGVSAGPAGVSIRGAF